MKDLDRVTVAGRDVRPYILQVSRDFMERAVCFPVEDPDTVPRLQREEAMKGLKAMASQ